MVTVITAIAEQMKRPTLNGTIEAARARETGGGCTVRIRPASMLRGGAASVTRS